MRLGGNVGLCAVVLVALLAAVGAGEQEIEPLDTQRLFLKSVKEMAASAPSLKYFVAEAESRIKVRGAVCAFFFGHPRQRDRAMARGVEGVEFDSRHYIVDLRGEMEGRAQLLKRILESAPRWDERLAGEEFSELMEQGFTHVWHVRAIVSPGYGEHLQRYELTINASGETAVITKVALDGTFAPVEFLEARLRSQIESSIEDFLERLFDGDGAAIKKRLPTGGYPFDGDNDVRLWVESTGMAKDEQPDPSPDRVTCVVRGSIWDGGGEGKPGDELSRERLTVILARRGTEWQVVSCRRDERYTREQADLMVQEEEMRGHVRRFLAGDEVARRAMMTVPVSSRFPIEAGIIVDRTRFGLAHRMTDDLWGVTCTVFAKGPVFDGGASRQSFYFELQRRGGRWRIAIIAPKHWR